MTLAEKRLWGAWTLLLAVGTGTVLGGAWLAGAMVYLSRLRGADLNRSLADRIHIDLLETRRREKDFLLRSREEPEFYRGGVPSMLALHRTALAQLGSDIESLSPRSPGEILERDHLLRRNLDYADAFGALVARTRELGTRDFGKIGVARAALAPLEARVSAASDAELSSHLARLRVLEVDFLAHPDPEALAAVGRRLELLLDQVRRSRPEILPQIEPLVEQERRDLAAVGALQEELGWNENLGLQGAYRNAAHAMEPIVDHMVRRASSEYDEASRRISWGLVASSIVLCALLSSTFFLTRAAKLRSLDLSRKTEDLRRSNAELQQFAYIASHDLQEPLRAVAGCVQLLEQHAGDQLDPKSRTLIRHAVEGSLRMQTMIEDLLTLSRVETQSKPPVATDCGKVLQAALDNLEVPIRESGALITHDPLPTAVLDPGQLLQVFQNLLSNAIKFRSQRPPRIHVSAVRHQDGWRFSVCDNGIGIDRQYFERIFRIFQRLHTRDEYPGSGIGLAVCEKIVLRHGGRIWLESEPDRGSTFYFSIPDKGDAG